MIVSKKYLIAACEVCRCEEFNVLYSEDEDDMLFICDRCGMPNEMSDPRNPDNVHKDTVQ